MRCPDEKEAFWVMKSTRIWRYSEKMKCMIIRIEKKKKLRVRDCGTPVVSPDINPKN